MQHKCAIVIKIILNSCNEQLIQGSHLDLDYFYNIEKCFSPLCRKPRKALRLCTQYRAN